MRTRTITRLGRLAWLVAASASAAAAPALPGPDPLPIEAFAGLPQVRQVALSPNGRWFAAIDNRAAEPVIVTHSTDGAEPARVVFRNDSPDATLAWARWVSDERLLISVRFPDRRGHTDTTESRLVAVDRDGSHVVTLAMPLGFGAGVDQVQDGIVDWLPGDGHHVLLQGRTTTSDTAVGVWRVDVDSGEREVVLGSRFGLRGWLTDRAHRVRVGVRQLGTSIEVLVCDPDGSNWRSAWAFDLFSAEAVRPLGFGADPNVLFVAAAHDGRRAVFSVDLREPSLARTLMLSLPQADVTGPLVIDPVGGQAVGVALSRFGGANEGFWEPAMKRFVQAIDAGLPERANRLLQFSADGSRYLVYSSGNGVPGRYLIGDRARGTLAVLAREYPGLPDSALVRKSALTVTARDGLKLQVLLTLPAGVAPRALPAVILPHGGPISMDTLDFDPLAEFIASRGYAVLQVNFRGSAGLGDAFRDAGLQRWGLEMQDDITDATAWLTERGTADPARLCIVGGSYGGYAALMGGAKTPALYRCVASVAGISDLIELGDTQARFVNGRAVFDRQVGSTTSDRQRLQDTSPRGLAMRFEAPVLLVHGTADRVVPFEQSAQMARALTAAGKSVRLVTLDNGDHQLGRASDRLRFYRELDAFLDSRIGAGRPVAAAVP